MKIAEAQSDRLVHVSHALLDRQYDYAIREDEAVGFVFPVYAWAAPSAGRSRSGGRSSIRWTRPPWTTTRCGRCNSPASSWAANRGNRRRFAGRWV